jgi:hypothetical protein
MAGTVQTKDILDMLEATRVDTDKETFLDISDTLQEYIVVPYLLTQRGGLKIQGGGVGFEAMMMVENGGYSTWVDEFAESTGTIIDMLKKMKVDFCLLNDNVAYTRGELLDNTGDNRLQNIIVPRNRAMRIRIAKTMERDFFGIPNAQDELTPWGLKYWIVKNATAGFNGGYASGFTKVGNIDLTQVPNFKNYTNTYTNIAKDDLILKMKRAHRATNFNSPVNTTGVTGDAKPKRRLILTNESVLEGMESIGESQNENLGNDMAPKTAGQNGPMGLMQTGDGDITFKRNPVIHARLLDDDTSDPLYGMDMSTFHALTKKGDNMNMGEYEKHPTQKRVFIADLFHRHQTICTNRRNNWVINK